MKWVSWARLKVASPANRRQPKWNRYFRRSNGDF